MSTLILVYLYPSVNYIIIHLVAVALKSQAKIENYEHTFKSLSKRLELLSKD
jgi:hypothetical protein